MSNLQLIEALCRLVEEQADIIRLLYKALALERAPTDSERSEVVRAEERYSEILGAGESWETEGDRMRYNEDTGRQNERRET